MRFSGRFNLKPHCDRFMSVQRWSYQRQLKFAFLPRVDKKNLDCTWRISTHSCRGEAPEGGGDRIIPDVSIVSVHSIIWLARPLAPLFYSLSSKIGLDARPSWPTVRRGLTGVCPTPIPPLDRAHGVLRQSQIHLPGSGQAWAALRLGPYV